MRILFFSTFILTVISLNGQFTNSNNTYSKQIELTSEMEDAWRLISDVSSWKKWDSHVIDARFSGDLRHRAKGSLVTSNSQVVDFQIVDFIEGESYTVRHKLSSGLLYIKRAIAESDIGSVLNVEVWFKGLSSTNFEKYMGDDYLAVLETELEDLKVLVEK